VLYTLPSGGNVSKSTVGDVGRSSQPPPVMRSEAPSSSDAAGTGGRAAPLPAPSGGGAGAGGGGRVGRARASAAPEPSSGLGLASHVNLEHLVSGLLQHCGRGKVVSSSIAARGIASCREKALVAGISGAVAVSIIKG
jgi:hypothetical protein